MDSKDVDKTISNWIDTIKHYSKPVHKQINPKNIVYYTSCDLSWIKDKSYCNSSLAERLSWILSLRRWKGNYCNNGIVINHISMNADSSLCDYKSIKQRLLLLFNYWNVIEYYYCLKQNNLNWDNILKEYLPLFVCSEEREIIPLFRSLSSHLHDSHGITIIANDSIPSFIPLNARMEDTLLVAIGETEEYIPNNSIIMAIDGREPKVLLKEYRDSLHSNYSTEAALLSSFISDGLRSNKDSCAIIFSYQGIVDSVTIPTLFPYEYRDWYITNRTARIPDIDLFDGICYINAGAYKRANCDFYYQKIQQAQIINICSMMSELGRETVSAYAAAKGGLKMLTRNICSEYGEYNIQCNGIGPGYIATPQTAPLRERQPDGSRHPFDSFICAKTPAGRWLEPEELGGPAVFLASHASDAVNGHVLYVDGGILAYIGKQPK